MSLKRAGNIGDVEVLFVDLDVAHQALKAVGPDADHESTGRGFLDRGDDVGERAVRERIVTGRARRRSYSCRGCWETSRRARRCRQGAAAGLPGEHAAGDRRQSGGTGAGTSTDGIAFKRGAERVARAERRQPGDIGLGGRPRRRRRQACSGAGTRSAPEPGSCSRACDTSPIRGIIKSP